MNKLKIIASIALSSACATHAAVLVEYTFDRVSATQIDFSADTLAGISAGSFTNTSGTTSGTSGVGLQTIAVGATSPSSITSFFNLSTNAAFNNAAVLWEVGGLATGTTSDMADAISSNQFMHFSMEVDDPNCFANLTSLTFDATQTGARGVVDLAVRSSLDGFTTDLTLDDTTTAAPTGLETHTVNLSAVAFDNVTSVEFRIYFDNRVANGNGGSGTSFDNFSLNGELSHIPEPSSTALLGLGVLGLLSRRRR